MVDDTAPVDRDFVLKNWHLNKMTYFEASLRRARRLRNEATALMQSVLRAKLSADEHEAAKLSEQWKQAEVRAKAAEARARRARRALQPKEQALHSTRVGKGQVKKLIRAKLHQKIYGLDSKHGLNVGVGSPQDEITTLEATARRRLETIENVRQVAALADSGMAPNDIAMATNLPLLQVSRMLSRLKQMPHLTDITSTELVLRRTAGLLSTSEMLAKLQEMPFAKDVEHPLDGYETGDLTQLLGMQAEGFLSRREYASIASAHRDLAG